MTIIGYKDESTGLITLVQHPPLSRWQKVVIFLKKQFAKLFIFLFGVIMGIILF